MKIDRPGKLYRKPYGLYEGLRFSEIYDKDPGHLRFLRTTSLAWGVPRGLLEAEWVPLYDAIEIVENPGRCQGREFMRLRDIVNACKKYGVVHAGLRRGEIVLAVVGKKMENVKGMSQEPDAEELAAWAEGKKHAEFDGIALRLFPRPRGPFGPTNQQRENHGKT